MIYEKRSIRRYRCLDESDGGLDSCSEGCRAAQQNKQYLRILRVEAHKGPHNKTGQGQDTKS